MKTKSDIVTLLKGFCDAYEKPMTEPLINIWATVLGDLSPEELSRASKEYLRGPNCAFFPKPGQIYQLARPDQSEGEASLIADRIWAACSYGTDSVGTERAKTFIGELGWAVVENHGGWSSFNRSVTSIDQGPILKAQWRKSVSEMMLKKKRGEPITQQLTNDGISLKTLGVDLKTLE